jgi:hypothetical protein
MAGRTAVYSNVTILVDGLNLSGQCNQASVNYSAEMLDVTTFGAVGNTRVRQGGLTTFSLGLQGFDFQGCSCSPEALLQPIIGSSGHMFTFFPTTIHGCQGCGYAGRAVVESYTAGGAVGAIMPFSANIVGTGVTA